MQVPISEAARLAGKSRKTLYNAVKSGRLSVTQDETGTTQVDIAELARVYGCLAVKGDSECTVKITQVETPVTQQITQSETTKIAILEAEVRQLKERLEDKDENLDDMRQALRLLEDKTAKEPKKGWFSRFFS